MMEGWEVKEIDNVCEEIVDCLNRTAPKVEFATPYKMIRTSNVRHGRIDLENVFYADEPTYKKWTRRLVPKKGDIILTREAPLGEVGILKTDDKVFLGQRTVMYRANPKVCDNRFLYYSLLAPFCQANIKAYASGSTVEHMKVPDSKKIKLKLPPLPTQRKIASILSAYDDLIENNLNRIKLLEEKAQLIYEEWFVRMKFPGHENTSFNKETGLPEGWEKKAIKDLGKLVSGFAFKSKDFVEDGNYKLVTIKNVQEGVFINKTSDTLSIIPEKVKPEHLLKDGDIIMSLTGNVGRTCMVYGENYLLNQRVLKIQPFHFKSFIYWLLRSRKTIKELENLSNGAAQQNLSPINMGKHKVVIPSKEFLKRFSEVFDLQLNVSIELNKQNQLLKEARDILLPRLMTGMIDVEQMNIETFQPTTA